MPLQQLATITSYEASEAAAFMRSRERYGLLSNMTGGFPVEVNGITFQSTEGLYQAMKFPHDPQRQQDIARARSGMEAKKVAYFKDRRPHQEWDDFRIDAMAITVAIKLIQHPCRFGRALSETSGLAIVEKSYRDTFWGARPSERTLTGANVLGKILQILADAFAHYADHGQAAAYLVQQADTSRLFVNSQPVRAPAPQTLPRGDS